MTAYPQYDENELVSRMQAGDEAAFTTVYGRYWDKLYFLAHRHLKSSEASEEIVQNVFVTLWNKRTELHINSLPLYLAAMTRYAVYRQVAIQKKRRQASLDELKAEPYESTWAPVENRLILEIVAKLSNQLPEKCRLVFVYNKLLDLPLKNVAEEMNISQKTAEAHLTKALKTIRGALGEALSVFFII